MSLILSLETSTLNCSVALHEKGQLISHELVSEEGSHSKALTLLIEKVLQTTGKKLTDIAAVAVSNGPGSYTGLRIGLATAKGICFGLDKPLICLPTLQILSSVVQAPAGSLLLPLLTQCWKKRRRKIPFLNWPVADLRVLLGWQRAIHPCGLPFLCKTGKMYWMY